MEDAVAALILFPTTAIRPPYLMPGHDFFVAKAREYSMGIGEEQPWFRAAHRSPFGKQLFEILLAVESMSKKWLQASPRQVPSLKPAGISFGRGSGSWEKNLDSRQKHAGMTNCALYRNCGTRPAGFPALSRRFPGCYSGLLPARAGLA